MPLTEITQDMRDEMLSGKLGEDIPIMKRMMMIYGGKMPVSKIKPLTTKQKADVFDQWFENHEKALGRHIKEGA